MQAATGLGPQCRSDPPGVGRRQRRARPARAWPAKLFSLALLFLCCDNTLAATADVLASRNDDGRTGANLREFLLRPDNVQPGSFGKLFEYPKAGGPPIGDVYAQPLYVSNVGIPGHGTANMLLVATMKNLVFAFDADGPQAGRDGVLWQRSLGTAPTMDDIWSNCSAARPCLPLIGGNIRGHAGIGGTPVIDRARSIVFLVSRVLAGPGQAVTYRLHALDLRNGQDLEGSPVDISGSAAGVTFNPNFQNQRPGLALTRGQVIIGFGAYEDFLPYHGWVFSYRYDASTGFTRSAAFVTTPDGDTSATCAVPIPTPASIAADAAVVATVARLVFDVVTLNIPMVVIDTLALAGAQKFSDAVKGPMLMLAANNCAHGGIWMAGRAPAIDADGRVLLMVGNGRNDLSATGMRNFGNGLLALDPVSLSVLDSFSPANHIALNARDLDLGGSGPMIVPGAGLVVGGGKQGVMNVWRLRSLGGFAAGDPGVVQSFVAGVEQAHVDTGNDNPGGSINLSLLFDIALGSGLNLSVHAGHIMGGPVFWPRSSAEGGSRLYNWSENSELRAYAFNAAASPPVTTPALDASQETQAGHPGGILTLSANGSRPGTGIVWATNYDASNTEVPVLGTTGALNKVVPGMVRAYSADDLSRPLWTSDLKDGDALGNLAKFNPVTVAAGRIYVPTFSDKIVVYGLSNHRYTRPAHAIGAVLNLLLDDE